MENSPLNEAHYQARRAEALLRSRKFDEAADCHRRAAELLTSALEGTTQPKALESIRLQRQAHLRQADLMKLKKGQYETLCKVLDMQMSKMDLPDDVTASGKTGDGNLHVAIFRTLEEADSLMVHLLHTDEKAPVEPERTDAPVAAEPALIRGSKQPKDDKVVVEELKTLTQHLHDLVKQLVTQLDASHRENESLRTQVRLLTTELEASIDDVSLPTAPESKSGQVGRQASDDSFMATRTLPILAPLEMPQFDFSVFEKGKEQEVPADEQIQ